MVELEAFGRVYGHQRDTLGAGLEAVLRAPHREVVEELLEAAIPCGAREEAGRAFASLGSILLYRSSTDGLRRLFDQLHGGANGGFGRHAGQ